MTDIICTECQEQMYVDPRGCMDTCMGYMSPPGHDHDDNCRSGAAVCVNGHKKFVSIRRTCSTPGCDWKGKDECFCHEGKKLEGWPTL